MSLITSIFPKLSNDRWGYINLAMEATLDTNIHSSPNPLLDPDLCYNWVKQLHAKYHIDYSYGGWLEDRHFLWRDSYLKDTNAIHLGVDFNVPAGTEIYSPISGVVDDVFYDNDRNGGWGGRIIIKTKPLWLFAHMSHSLPARGTEIKIGDYLGTVGISKENGNWFPHLHVQCLDASIMYNNTELDGYGGWYSLMPKVYPDPMGILLS